jgi:hypothetical protein
MNLDDCRVGDLIEFKRQVPYSSESFVNIGIFLGFEFDITPSRMSNYIRLHMLESGGRVYSAICWVGKDTITKIE